MAACPAFPPWYVAKIFCQFKIIPPTHAIMNLSLTPQLEIFIRECAESGEYSAQG